MDSGTKEIGQRAAGEGDAVAEGGQYPEASRSVDSLGEMRLAALLGDMIEAQGKAQAAETLGVSVRTLGRFEESGRLTRILASALETHLLKAGGSAADRQRRQAADRQRRQAADVAERVAQLEKALSEGLGALHREGEKAREEQARALAELERRLAALEAAGAGTAAGNGGAPKGNPAPAAKPVVERPRRKYYDLVTAEAEPGEDQVYGEAATAVVVRWREARDAFSQAKDALDVLNARQRRVELEVELIQEHELTLPPSTRPWDWGDRRQEVRRRNEMLYEVNVDRKMLKLRRFLTFGIWRK